jgi:hypothetical protein
VDAGTGGSRNTVVVGGVVGRVIAAEIVVDTGTVLIGGAVVDPGALATGGDPTVVPVCLTWPDEDIGSAAHPARPTIPATAAATQARRHIRSPM